MFFILSQLPVAEANFQENVVKRWRLLFFRPAPMSETEALCWAWCAENTGDPV